jgi:uncharacterized glyoxalase superfamily protein PhnB
MTAILCMLLMLTAPPDGAQTREKPAKEKTMNVKKSTPVLLVAEIEPILKFWERVGFVKTVEVPEGDKIGFVILQNGPVELMYQTYTSGNADVGADIAADMRKGPTFLYVEVENLDEVLAALHDVPKAMEIRTTFYGAREFGVRDPGGHYVTFAQMGAPPSH